MLEGLEKGKKQSLIQITRIDCNETKNSQEQPQLKYN